jgi:hypothetical protein
MKERLATCDASNLRQLFLKVTEFLGSLETSITLYLFYLTNLARQSVTVTVQS